MIGQKGGTERPPAETRPNPGCRGARAHGQFVLEMSQGGPEPSQYTSRCRWSNGASRNRCRSIRPVCRRSTIGILKGRQPVVDLAGRPAEDGSVRRLAVLYRRPWPCDPRRRRAQGRFAVFAMTCNTLQDWPDYTTLSWLATRHLMPGKGSSGLAGAFENQRRG